MASFSSVLFAVTFFVTTCSAAPQNTKLSIKIPDGCGPGFCSIRPEGYDEIEEKMNQLLPPYLIDVADREGEAETYFKPEADEDNCPSEIKTELPTVYSDPEHPTKVEYIVQTKLFPQRYDNIVCKNVTGEHHTVNQQCFKDLGLGSAFNLKYRCQESHGIRSLLIYDPDKHRIESKNYKITVCCSCKITTV